MSNDTHLWQLGILHQISQGMPISGLQSKNHLTVATITEQSYHSRLPQIEIGSVNSPCRNLFLVKQESDIYDVACRVVEPELSSLAYSSILLRRAAEKKPAGYRQFATVLAKSIAQAGGQSPNATAKAEAKAEAVLSLLSRRINDAEGKWLNDFKGFLNHWLKQQTQISNALDVSFTVTYYEAITAKHPTLRSTAQSTASMINPIAGRLLESLNYNEKTSTQSLWSFFQQRRDFFNPREILLQGVPSLRLRSGSQLTFQDNFQQVNFSPVAAGNSRFFKSCVNNPAILRSAWEDYIEHLFSDDWYFSAYLSVIDLSLSATLDRVITGQYPAYATVNATQQRAYRQQAEAIRVGNKSVTLLQHHGEINVVADRLILISGDNPLRLKRQNMRRVLLYRCAAA